MADLLGVSERWYNAFENGGVGGTPSDDLLNRLADILRMREAERLRLYLLVTGREPATRGNAPGDRSESSPVFRLTELLGSDLPALLCDIAWNIQAWSPAMAERIGNPGIAPASERNAATWLFTPQAIDVIDNLHEVQTSMLAQVHLALARHPDDPRLEHLVDRILKTPKARKIWKQQQIADNPDISRRRLLRPGMETDADLVTLTCPGEMRLLVLVPRGRWPGMAS